MKFYGLYKRKPDTLQYAERPVSHKADQWMKQYNKPIIYDECCYEGNISFPWGKHLGG